MATEWLFSVNIGTYQLSYRIIRSFTENRSLAEKRIYLRKNELAFTVCSSKQQEMKFDGDVKNFGNFFSSHIGFKDGCCS